MAKRPTQQTVLWFALGAAVLCAMRAPKKPRPPLRLPANTKSGKPLELAAVRVAT